MRCIPDRIILERRVRRVVDRARGIVSRARGGGADRCVWQVCVQREKFMVSVRADITDAKRSTCRDLLLEFQRP